MSAKLTPQARFGLLFALVFALIAVLPLFHGASLRSWAVAIAAVLLGLSLWRPLYLDWPFKIWMAFGTALHHIISPVVMGLLFFCVFTPAGLLMRMLGKRPLTFCADPTAKTYWIERERPAPAKDSMKFGF